MNIRFIDIISDYTDVEYLDTIEDVIEPEESIMVPLQSDGIDDIVEYLHGIDPWKVSFTENHMSIVRYLGLKKLYWILDT